MNDQMTSKGSKWMNVSIILQLVVYLTSRSALNSCYDVSESEKL